MLKWDFMKGWAKHRTFGLRKEWLAAYLAYYPDWEDKVSLGNRQVESLKVWSRTGGLEEKGRLSPLGKFFQREDLDNLELWQFLWVKIVFNFPTARWYVHQGTGSFTYAELREKMQKDVPRLRARTVQDALTELIGLFRYTPIGREIGQGEIKILEDGPSRYYVERGGTIPGRRPLVMALVHLFAEEGTDILNLEADLTWPWTVFGCQKEDVFLDLFSYDGLFDWDRTRNALLWRGKEEDMEQWRTGSILII